MISNEPEGSYLYKLSRSPGDSELAHTGQKVDPVTKTYTKRSKPNHPGRQVGTTTVVISSLNWPEALRGPGIFCHGRQTLDKVQSGALTGPRQFILYTITQTSINPAVVGNNVRKTWLTQASEGPPRLSIPAVSSLNHKIKFRVIKIIFMMSK